MNRPANEHPLPVDLDRIVRGVRREVEIARKPAA